MPSKSTSNLLGAVLAVILLTMAAAGCGSGSAKQDAASPADARHYAADHIQARLAAVVRLPPVYQSARELLGNVRYAEGSGQGEAITDAVVVGTIRDVSEGYGFAQASSGAEGTPFRDGTVRVPFDSQDALWRTVHITVDVEDVLSGDLPESTQQITVGLAIGNANADADLIKQGITAIGRSVWFLRHDSPVFSYDRSLYADIEDGGLIAHAAPDGSLSFPLLPPDEAAATVLGRPTVADLREAAQAPPRVVKLHADGNVWVR